MPCLCEPACEHPPPQHVVPPARDVRRVRRVPPGPRGIGVDLPDPPDPRARHRPVARHARLATRGRRPGRPPTGVNARPVSRPGRRHPAGTGRRPTEGPTDDPSDDRARGHGCRGTRAGPGRDEDLSGQPCGGTPWQGTDSCPSAHEGGPPARTRNRSPAPRQHPGPAPDAYRGPARAALARHAARGAAPAPARTAAAALVRTCAEPGPPRRVRPDEPPRVAHARRGVEPPPVALGAPAAPAPLRSADFLPRVVLGQDAVDPGLVEPRDDVLALLGVAHALGEGERRGGQEQGAEGEERLGPRLARQVVDRDQHGEHGDAEGDGRLGEEGIGVLRTGCLGFHDPSVTTATST